MKKLFLFFSPVLLMIFLTGCPYSSKVALSDPANSNIDTLLLGEWYGNKITDSSDLVDLNIQKFNEHEYLIEYRMKNAKNQTNSENWRGFSTRIKNKNFMSVNVVGEPDAFVFYKYEIKDGVLKISYASDELIKQQFATSKELVEYFEKNMDTKKFFEKELVFKRKK
jgi:hypothetical protein